MKKEYASGHVYAKKKYSPCILLLSNILITFQLYEVYQNGPITTRFFSELPLTRKQCFYAEKTTFFLNQLSCRYVDILKCVSIY